MKLNQKYLRCKRCHRRLKTEEAQKKGYGYHCFQLYLDERKKKSKNLIDIAEEMKQGNI